MTPQEIMRRAREAAAQADPKWAYFYRSGELDGLIRKRLKAAAPHIPGEK